MACSISKHTLQRSSRWSCTICGDNLVRMQLHGAYPLLGDSKAGAEIVRHVSACEKPLLLEWTYGVQVNWKRRLMTMSRSQLHHAT